jgi:hypothetical protein
MRYYAAVQDARSAKASGFSGSSSRFIPQNTLLARLLKSLPPQDHRITVHVQIARDGAVRLSDRCSQHNGAAQAHLLRCSEGRHLLAQLLLVRFPTGNASVFRSIARRQ